MSEYTKQQINFKGFPKNHEGVEFISIGYEGNEGDIGIGFTHEWYEIDQEKLIKFLNDRISPCMSEIIRKIKEKINDK